MKKVSFWLNLTASIALAVLCGWLFFERGESLTDAKWSLPLWYVAFLLVAVPVVDFVHELGHIIVGNCLKMGVGFPKIKFFSSSSVSVNPKTDKALKGRMVATSLAGIIFTLAIVIFGVVALFVPQIPAVCICLLPYAFYLTINNALPFEYGGDRTDGLVAYELIFDKPEGQVLLTLLTVVAKLNLGENLEDVDESLIMDVPQLCDDDAYFYILTQLRADYYSARGEEEKAQKYQERLAMLNEEF